MIYFIFFKTTQRSMSVPARLEDLYFKSIESEARTNRATAIQMLARQKIDTPHYSFSSELTVDLKS